MPASPASYRAGMWRRWRLVMILLLLALFQDFASTSDIYSTLSLRKCYCDKFQAWDGTSCRDNITTIIPIYQQNFDGTQEHVIDVAKFAAAHQTSRLENVAVQDLQCSEGLYRTTLSNDILLLPDGRLLWLRTNTTIPQESFCIVNVWDNGQTYFDANVCLPPPAVPRCCPVDHLMGRDGSCYPHKALKAPVILIGNHEVDWNSLDGDMVPLTCEEHEYHHYVHLREGEGQLGGTHPTAALGWNPPVWTASRTWATKYCVAMQEGEAGELQYVAQICVKDYTRYHEEQCGAATCVRKCCPEDGLLHHGMCVQALSEEEIWHPSRIPNQTVNEEWKIVAGEPGCPSYPHQEAIHLLPNGFLQLSPDIPAVSPSQYCIENLLDETENIRTVALICTQTTDTECLWRDILIKVVMGVSCAFLVATLVVYLGVAELRGLMYGRCLISMVAAMLTAYFSLMFGPEDFSSEAGCFARAFIAHLSSLAVFFWLNVMCFDMWKILRGSTRQHHSMKVFLGYSVYAWGCPLVISIVTLALDVAHPAGNLILPQYFHGSCWFNGNAAYWVYFSGFILLLVLINVGFFVHVAITLTKKMKQREQTFETNASHTNKTTNTKKRVWLFVKLFLVMGVLWITDALSAVGHRRTCTYWVVTDVINALQGVFIFIVAVCTKDNLKKIKDAWWPRLKVVQKNLPSFTSRRPTQTNILSTYDTEDSRKTSITSIPQKISQASSILFSSSKKSASLSPPPDRSTNYSGERKGSNVSIKDIIPLSTLKE